MAKEPPRMEFKLTPAQKQELQRLEKSIATTRKQIQGLKKTGLDVSELESKLDWAESVRTTLLEEFS